MRPFTTSNKIRELTSENTPVLISLSSETSAKNWKSSDFDYFLNSKNGYSIGFFEEEQLCGYLIVLKIQEEADIINLAIHPNYRHQGIATQLLSQMLLDLNAKKIFLEVDTENTSAINLYKKFHFITLGIRKKYYEGKKDAFQMVLDLNLEDCADSLNALISTVRGESGLTAKGATH
jgi:ribosomal-protein-alanine N-acetyltransferase